MHELVKKTDSKLIGVKWKAGNMMKDFLTAKREGSHWVDLGSACVVGLALAVIFRDQLSGVIESIGTKIKTSVGSW